MHTNAKICANDEYVDGVYACGTCYCHYVAAAAAALSLCTLDRQYYMLSIITDVSTFNECVDSLVVIKYFVAITVV